MKAALSIFVGALALGAAAGWVSLKGNDGGKGGPGVVPEKPSSTTAATREATPLPRERPLPTTTGLMDESKAWMKRITEKGYNPYSDETAKWTDEEIRSALEESLRNRDFLMDSGNARYLASALMREWMKRDCIAASEFFLSIPAPIRNGAMTYSFSVGWPADRAAEGLAFVKANPMVFEAALPWSILLKNIEARSVEGAESVIALLVDLRESKLGLGFENPVKMPENFDFATLMSSPEMETLSKEGQGKFFTRAWLTQDRDACLEWVKERGGLRDMPGLIAFGEEDSVEGLRWLGSKYEEMDPADRAAMLAGIPPGNAAVVGMLAAGIGDRAVADSLRAVAAEWVFAGQVHEAVNVLTGISDPARRLQVLEEVDQAKMRSVRPMSQGDAQILRKSLLEWNATPERAEAIVTKFQRPR